MGIAPSHYGEHSEALYLTSCFVQPDAATSADRFANPDHGYTYSRTGNPSVTSFEQRLAAMEDAQAAIATATGFKPLADDGIRRVLGADTSLEEIARVIDLTERALGATE